MEDEVLGLTDDVEVPEVGIERDSLRVSETGRLGVEARDLVVARRGYPVEPAVRARRYPVDLRVHSVDDEQCSLRYIEGDSFRIVTAVGRGRKR